MLSLDIGMLTFSITIISSCPACSIDEIDDVLSHIILNNTIYRDVEI